MATIIQHGPAELVSDVSQPIKNVSVVAVNEIEHDAVNDNSVAANSAIIQLLKPQIKKGKVLLPGEIAYEAAVDIGNLLYRMQTPAAVVQPGDKWEVQATVRFARQHDFKMTPKNGGHSYAGYCLNRGGIVLDLSLMKGVEFDIENMTVTLQAGCQWKDAYNLLHGDKSGIMVIGGQCPGVGASGFTLGGGLSPFSRSYGLGADNVLEMEIVTADGELVKVSAESTSEKERDLFWALRGGGGGNFGVTVAFKSRLHRTNDNQGRVVCGELTWKIPEQESDFLAAMDSFNNMKCPDALTLDAIWRFDDHDNLMAQMTILYNGDKKACEQAIAPLTAHRPDDDTKEQNYRDWSVFSEGFDVKSKVYHHHSSFILAEGTLTPELSRQMVDLMKQAAIVVKSQNAKAPLIPIDPSGPTGPVLGPVLPIDSKPPPTPSLPKSRVTMLWDHIGGATSRLPSDATPFYYRHGVYAVNVKIQWTEPSQAIEMLQLLDQYKAVLAPVSIDGCAAYLNYIDSTLENWQAAYYGANYERLRKIKFEWDPTWFWRFEQGIEPLFSRDCQKDDTNSLVPQSSAEVSALPLAIESAREAEFITGPAESGSGIPARWEALQVSESDLPCLLCANTTKEILAANQKIRASFF